MEIIKEFFNFIVLFILAIVFIVLILVLGVYISEWLTNILYKTFTIIMNPFKKLLKKLPPSPHERYAKLKTEYDCLNEECERLKKELKSIKRERNNAYVRYKKNSEFQQAEHDREIGQVVTSKFNDIILSFIESQPLAPNVSIEHLANLCRIPNANDRFFRALLQEFEILHLEIKRENGKHDITMEIKSDKNTYTTTLTDCTCRDFYSYNGQKVCKHMYFLALTLGLISSEHYEKFLKNALESLDEEKIKSLKKKK